MRTVAPVTEQFRHFVADLKESFWGDVYGELQRTGNEAKAMGVVVKGKSFGSIIASEIFTVGFSTTRTNSPAPSSASSSTPEAALQ